jgi:hypothetical protein
MRISGEIITKAKIGRVTSTATLYQDILDVYITHQMPEPVEIKLPIFEHFEVQLIRLDIGVYMMDALIHQHTMS